MLVNEFIHNGKTVTIHTDDDAQSPREGFDVGVMLCGHRRYSLGDSHDEAQRALDHFAGSRRGWSMLFARWCRIYLGSTSVIALGLYDHSGISMYTLGDLLEERDRNLLAVRGTAHPQDTGGWDSGLVGFIFDTTKTREITGVAPENVRKALLGEVKTYDEYLTGEVYGYEVVDPETGEEDSCWGFYGNDYVEQEARDAAGYTCQHCEHDIKRWVGPVVDERPEGSAGFVHSACATCLRDVAWGRDLSAAVHQHAGHWYHLLGVEGDRFAEELAHDVEITHRHACWASETFAQTTEKVNA